MLTPPQSDVAGVVKKLSVAQREAVAQAENGVVPTHYRTAVRVSNPTFSRLARLGLTASWPPRLTPLGLAARQLILSAQSRTEGEAK